MREKGMAGISCCSPSCQFLQPLCLQKVQRIRCCSSAPNSNKRETQTPKIIKLAVTGVTEVLRLFIPANSNSNKMCFEICESYTVLELIHPAVIVRSLEDFPYQNFCRLELGYDRGGNEYMVSNVDDVLMNIKTDFENAYFVTGLFTSAIYADDCIFEDPTIKFRGKDLYSRNLKLLVPFLDSPSIELKKIEKGMDPSTDTIIALWKLRTRLKLPWKPLILVEGTTVYDLDDNLKIVRHVESWNVSALEAIRQIFTPDVQKQSQ